MLTRYDTATPKRSCYGYLLGYIQLKGYKRGLIKLDPTAGRSLTISMLCTFKWSAGPMPLSIRTWGDPNGPAHRIISFLVCTTFLSTLLPLPDRVARWTPRATFGRPSTLSSCSICKFSTMVLVAMWRLCCLWRARSFVRKAKLNDDVGLCHG